jgi:hypothetical protein
MSDADGRLLAGNDDDRKDKKPSASRRGIAPIFLTWTATEALLEYLILRFGHGSNAYFPVIMSFRGTIALVLAALIGLGIYLVGGAYFFKGPAERSASRLLFSLLITAIFIAAGWVFTSLLFVDLGPVLWLVAGAVGSMATFLIAWALPPGSPSSAKRSGRTRSTILMIALSLIIVFVLPWVVLLIL